jgi:hypothetical protein
MQYLVLAIIPIICLVIGILSVIHLISRGGFQSIFLQIVLITAILMNIFSNIAISVHSSPFLWVPIGSLCFLFYFLAILCDLNETFRMAPLSPYFSVVAIKSAQVIYAIFSFILGGGMLVGSFIDPSLDLVVSQKSSIPWLSDWISLYKYWFILIIFYGIANRPLSRIDCKP